MGSITVSRSVKSPGGTGEWRRALSGGGLNDGRDFEGSGRQGISFAFTFASTGSGIGGNSLVKLASAIMKDIGLRTTWRRGSGLLRGVPGDYRRGKGAEAVGPVWGGVGAWGGELKRKVWGEKQGVPHYVTGQKRSYEGPGSPGR